MNHCNRSCIMHLLLLCLFPHVNNSTYKSGIVTCVIVYNTNIIIFATYKKRECHSMLTSCGIVVKSRSDIFCNDCMKLKRFSRFKLCVCKYRYRGKLIGLLEEGC